MTAFRLWVPVDWDALIEMQDASLRLETRGARVVVRDDSFRLSYMAGNHHPNPRAQIIARLLFGHDVRVFGPAEVEPLTAKQAFALLQGLYQEEHREVSE